jgi:hypothetical protein
MKVWLALFAVGLVAYPAMTSLAVTRGGDDRKGSTGKFKITSRRSDDTIEVQAEKGKTVFAVKSPFGISQAVIERVEDMWPEAVGLRLHLKGLSSFRASNGKVRVDAAVSIDEGKAKVRMWKDGKEDAPLDEKSPLWTAIRIGGGDGKGATAPGWVLRGCPAPGVLRGQPQGDHAELDRLLQELMP